MRIRVASLADVPSQTGLAVRHEHLEIALFRIGDEVYALENSCPHLGAPLSEGYLIGNLVSCPYHAWEICVRTGSVQHNPHICAAAFPAEVVDGEVFIIL